MDNDQLCIATRLKELDLHSDKNTSFQITDAVQIYIIAIT